jgi:prolyl-tRNA editing enzyme YbaK/EbsC (Cys-tRNA(Pro) deacylase)
MRVPQDGWLLGDYSNVVDRSAENLSPSARVQTALIARGVAAEVRQFPDSTRTAADAAAAIGTTVGQIVKSLVFLSGTQPVLALVSGANRLALPQLSSLVGSAVGKADADAVRRATGYAIGGVPPTGFPSPIPTYLDRDLLQYDTVWAAAGTPHHVFPIAPADLVRITGATVADLKE